MKFLKNMSIVKRLYSMFAIIFIFTGVMEISAVGIAKSTGDSGIDLYEQYGKTCTDISMTYANFQLIKVEMRNILYVYPGDVSKRNECVTKINEVVADVTEDLTSCYERITDETLLAQFTEATTYLNNYIGIAQDCITYLENDDMDAAIELFTTAAVPEANSAEAGIQQVLATADTNATAEKTALERNITYNSIAITVIGLFVCVLMFLTILDLTRAIKKPIKKLMEVSDRLAVGEVDVKIEKEADNEFGILMDKFTQMIENIRYQADIAMRVAKGDLTVDVVPKSEKDVVGNALLTLVKDDNSVLGNIKESSMQVTTGSEHVAAASQSLAQGSTEQASALQEVMASIDEIAQKTKVNATDANEANRLVNEAKEEAIKGNSQMKDMTVAMKDINESSENISKIIKVIDDIAFQTNILALNAAVEAARAGAHGKGFAVVAEEVRNLAGKSASAASETAEMIKDSIDKVEKGSALVTETAEALQEIVTSIDHIVELISGIATASNDQATAVAQIDQAITQVSQVVQTNSATSEECAAASEELSTQANNLRDLIAKFNLKELNYKASYIEKSAPPVDFSPSESYSDNTDNESIISLNGFGKY